jgi:hypothetical protein
MRRQTLGITLALAAAVMAGCDTKEVDSSNWIQNAQDRTLVEVPKTFKRITPDPFRVDKFDLEATRTAGQKRNGPSWVRIFDSAKKPSEKNFDEPRPNALVGQVAVYTLRKEWRDGPNFRDGVNLKVLRSPILSSDGPDPIAEFNNGNPSYEIVNYEEIARPNGIHGVKIRFNQRIEGSQWVTYDHQAYTNTNADKIYTLTMLCSSTCFKENYNTVRSISSSFSVQN